MDAITERKNRSQLFYRIIVSLSLIVFVAIVWALRTMIVPATVGALLAYACLPLLRKLKKTGLPDGLALLILLGTFVLGIMLVTDRIKHIIPDEIGKVLLRVRIQYKVYERYNDIVGGDKTFITETLAKEIDPVFKDFVGILSLSPMERNNLDQHFNKHKDTDPNLERYYQYHQTNLARQERLKDKEDSIVSESEQESAKSKTASQSSLISKVSDVISIWLVAPFVFLFLLVDNGQIKRSLIMLAPNRYFEMVLTIIDNVDDAIGKYLRGTLLECSLVGFSFMACLFMIGIDLQWALLIGIIAGLSNAIPFLGPAIGMVVGMSYALIAEDMQPVLPFIDPDNIIIWVLITVGIVQALDNVVFQPIVLGTAVSLHPLVVIFGVMGGSVVFGFAGMLFAIPTIVIVKEVLSTLVHEMKAYHLIE
ncbi:MAG: AI-2E family transporter [Deltaproteobacteria bacterium]|jgi:predicted PurR-regulated permease PerM|nr:AI-2E family transporter [Deltaproteobacteria bacterium]MBT4642294.1 AI-2E family transporter [Deltaproteobacteria bacterium]MBT6504717.1 AI-2E family transporter [Deltaproteobacteria bacterium]MBT6616303.1 AI-2E family transporter [Deltaproteobacteria bacterium]MBT7152063.1 AI-2E family transporter [Deltaproteobacteria bacterium]